MAIMRSLCINENQGGKCGKLLITPFTSICGLPILNIESNFFYKPRQVKTIVC